MKFILLLLFWCLSTAAQDSGETPVLTDLSCNGERASEIGYAFESITGLPISEMEGGQRLAQFCLETDKCELLDVALDRYRVCTDAVREQRSQGRLLAGLPDKHNW